MTESEILANFKILGLKPKLAVAYFSLLKLQKANAHQIAKDADIERTNIYNILDELEEKGLVLKSIKGKRLLYIAEPPTKFAELLLRQESALKQLLPVLELVQGNKKFHPRIKFYENEDGIKKVLTDSLNAQEKIRRDFASVENVIEVLGLRFVNNQIKKRVKRGIFVRSLRCAPQGNKISEKDWYLKKDNKDLLREVRYLDKGIQLAPLIMIYDHVVAVISSKEEFYALVIESADLSQALKVLFDIAWNQANK